MTAHTTRYSISTPDDAPFPAARRPFALALHTPASALARPSLLLAGAVLVALLPIGEAVGHWVWALSLLVIGMPHGAYDLAGMHASSPSPRHTAFRFARYTSVMIACTVAFLVAPAFTLVAFLLLSAHHFGVSDSVFTRGRTPRSLRDHAAGLARGLVVIATPFAVQPDRAWAIFAEIGAVAGSVWTPDPAVARSVAITLVVPAVVATFAMCRRAARADAIEESATLFGVIVLSFVAHPLVAIGLYFVVVHASGHCLRAHLPGRPASVPGLRNAWRVHRAGAALTLVSVGMTLALVPLFGTLSVQAIALAFLLFCVVATLPHHLMWMKPASPRLG